MLSANEAFVIYAIIGPITIVWIWAIVAAVRGALRWSTWTSYFLVALVLVGGPIFGLVYLITRTRFEPEKASNR